MLKTKYKMSAKVWLWPGLATWHMVTLPKRQSDQINELFSAVHRGWKSLPVTVSIGKTTWQTSIFLDSKQDAYILPLKAAVRKKESISAGQTITFTLQVRP